MKAGDENGMRVVVMASRKGGAGKSTLCGHLGVEANARGYGPVSMIDCDEQGSLSRWWSLRWSLRHAAKPTLARVDDGRLRATLGALEGQGTRLVLIDTASGIGAAIGNIVASAHLVLVPVQPSPHDLHAVAATVALAGRTRREMMFVLNRTKPRVRMTAEAAIALSAYGMVCPVMIGDRVDLSASMIDGRVAAELAPDGRSAGEIGALWRCVAGRLGWENANAADQSHAA